MSVNVRELIEILRSYPEDFEVMVAAGPDGDTICPVDAQVEAGFYDYDEEAYYQDFSDDGEEDGSAGEDNNVVVLWTDNL